MRRTLGEKNCSVGSDRLVRVRLIFVPIVAAVEMKLAQAKLRETMRSDEDQSKIYA